jgi:hypothetical protein
MAELRAAEIEFVRRLKVALPEGAKEKEVVEYVMGLSLFEFSEYLSSLCGTTAEIKYLIRERGRLISSAGGGGGGGGVGGGGAVTSAAAFSSSKTSVKSESTTSSSKTFSTSSSMKFASSTPPPPPLPPLSNYESISAKFLTTNRSDQRSNQKTDQRSDQRSKISSQSVNTPPLAVFTKVTQKTPSMLDIPTGKTLSERGQYCACMATKHRCLGNCINCGKIICEAEADRYCTFCDAELPFAANLSMEQLLQLRTRISEANLAAAHQAAAAASSSSAVTFKRGTLKADAPSFTPISTSSNLKSSSSVSTSASSFVIKAADERLLNSTGMAQAIAHKNKLLDYQTNSAQRTTVRDDDAEWFSLSGTSAAGGTANQLANSGNVEKQIIVDSNSVWLSPDDRKRAAEMERARIASVSNRQRVTRLQIDYTQGGAEVTADSVMSNK